MTKAFRRLAVIGLSAAMQGGLIAVAPAQGTPPLSSAGGPAPQYGAPETGQATEPAAPSEKALPAELPVLYVTSVEVFQTAFEPKLDIVRVTGLTGSAGWYGPELVPTFAGKPADGVLDLEFIATPPEGSQDAQGFVPIGAIFTLPHGYASGGVRVRASENVIEVKQIPGRYQTTINVNGCAHCIGKKFVEKGQAQPGQQGVVYRQELPESLRLIGPSRGIRGSTQDPNRLTLVLGDDDKIVAAFWE